MRRSARHTRPPREPSRGSTGASQARGRWTALLLFGTATFLFWAALYVYVPFLPVYAESMGASLSVVGAIVASYAIAQVLLRAPMGIWADFLGRRKPFVAAGLLTASMGALALAAAPSPWFLFAGRTLAGVAAATWVISTVFFASYFPQERAARGIGIISFVNSISVVAATFVGGQMAEAWGEESVFFIGAGLGLLGALFLIPVREPPVSRTHALLQDTILRLATHPVVLMASLISVLVHFAFTATISSFTLVYAARIGASAADLGVVSAAYLGSATLATLAAVYMVERRGYSLPILLGAATMGITLLVTPLVTDLRSLEGLQLLTGAGRGLLTTTLMAMSISAIAPAHRASAMGIYQALYSVGMLAGPILGGVAADGLGLPSVFYISGTCALLAGALVFVRKLPGPLAADDALLRASGRP